MMESVQEITAQNCYKRDREIENDPVFICPSFPLKTIAEFERSNKNLLLEHYLDQIILRVYDKPLRGIFGIFGSIQNNM